MYDNVTSKIEKIANFLSKNPEMVLRLSNLELILGFRKASREGKKGGHMNKYKDWGDKNKKYDDWKKHSEEWGKKGNGAHHDEKHWADKGWKKYDDGKKGKKMEHWDQGKKEDHWKKWEDKWNYDKDKGHGYVKSYSWDKEHAKKYKQGSKGGQHKDYKHGEKKDIWEKHNANDQGHWKQGGYKHNDDWKHKDYKKNWGDHGQHKKNNEKWGKEKYDDGHHWAHKNHKHGWDKQHGWGHGGHEY
uniref:Uncharacterized protein n=1 Tax=Tetranychus urticae TaxID=32264 RepID=T1JW60_TETUR